MKEGNNGNSMYQASDRLEALKAKGSDTTELESYITARLKAVRPVVVQPVKE
jgi:hypothetical protein